MDSLSSSLIIKALDGLSTRALVTAQNIANSATPGYRPLRVSFEQVLAAASGQGVAAIDAVTPQIEPAEVVTGMGSDMRLDLELATAASTSLRYGALIEVLNRQMQLNSIAISGTR